MNSWIASSNLIGKKRTFNWIKSILRWGFEAMGEPLCGLFLDPTLPGSQARVRLQQVTLEFLVNVVTTRLRRKFGLASFRAHVPKSNKWIMVEKIHHTI